MDIPTNTRQGRRELDNREHREAVALYMFRLRGYAATVEAHGPDYALLVRALADTRKELEILTA